VRRPVALKIVCFVLLLSWLPVVWTTCSAIFISRQSIRIWLRVRSDQSWFASSPLHSADSVALEDSKYTQNIRACWLVRGIWGVCRDGFRQRGALGHLSFWSPAQVWPIWPFVWKAWMCAPRMCGASSKIYLLLCRIWFYECLRSGISELVIPLRSFANF